MNQPLHSAALGAEEAVAAHQSDCWWAVALLYVGAVRQLDTTPPTLGKQSTPLLPSLADVPAGHPLAGKKWETKIRQSVATLSHPDLTQAQCTTMALRLILELGRPLHSRLAYLLSICPDPHNPYLLPSLFTQHLQSTDYRLMLAAFDNRHDCSEDEETLGQQLVKNLPANGWSVNPPKILLPYVRVFPIGPLKAPRVWYLEKLLPQANARLAALTAADGLRLAAIPMHRELRIEFKTIEENCGVCSIRVKPPTAPSVRWQEHLTEVIKTCARKKILVAVLPELMGGTQVNDVVLKALAECHNGYPLLVVGASSHEDEGGVFHNRAHIYASSGKGRYEAVCHHDKFERYAENGMVEGCELGPGLTFLVTAIGVIAIGICKDWFFTRGAGSAKGLTQFKDAQPILAIAPALSSSVLEIKNLGGLLKETRTPLIFANACGPVSSQLRNGQCCAVEQIDQEPKLYDARSFIACPKAWATMLDTNERLVTSGEQGIWVIHAPCKEKESNDNTVYAQVIPKKPDK